MTTIAVLAITMSLAVPSMTNALDRSWAQSAAEGIADQLRFARSESIKRNQEINVAFGGNGWGSSDWCMGLTSNPDCDCTNDDVESVTACTLTVGGEAQLKTISSENFKDIKLWEIFSFTGGNITFDPVRGTTNSGFIYIRTRENNWVLIRTTILGRLDICSNNISAYPQC